MEILIRSLQAGSIILGLILILVAYRHRSPEYKSYWDLKPWSRQGINPLYPLTLLRIRYLWTPAGFRLHVLGVFLFAAGILGNAAAILIRWLS
jgi:hypothetical protein